jgi:hypothetical protein
MVTTRRKPWIGRVGFVLGILLAAAIIATGSVPGGNRALSAELKLGATATGGLAVAPEGRVLSAHRLAPGAPGAEGAIKLLNQTSERASVLVRAKTTDPALDGLVRLQLRAGHGSPLRATLGELRRWRRLAPALAPQHRERVAVRVWIPASVDGGHEGRRAEVTLDFVRKGAQG